MNKAAYSHGKNKNHCKNDYLNNDLKYDEYIGLPLGLYFLIAPWIISISVTEAFLIQPYSRAKDGEISSAGGIHPTRPLDIYFNSNNNNYINSKYFIVHIESINPNKA